MTALDIIVEMHYEGFSAKDIHTKLVELFKKKAPAYSSVTRNIRFLSFQQDIEVGEKLMGRPVDLYNCDKVRLAIENFENASIRELSQLTNVPPTSVYRYLTQQLGYVNRIFRWIPHMLSKEHKNNRVELSKNLLNEIEKAKSTNFRFFVTGDESWFYYTFDNKSQWVKDGMQAGTKVNHGFSTPKIMVSIFWSIDGIRNIDCVESGQSMDSSYFISNVLTPISESELFNKAKKQKKKFSIHMDNAPIHKSAKTKKFLSDKGFHVPPHPAYSPDLAPSDFYLLGKLKTHPGSVKFSSPDEIVMWIEDKFSSITKEELIRVFQAWEERLRWVIANKGEYYPE